jgi:hypothetical protein
MYPSSILFSSFSFFNIYSKYLSMSSFFDIESCKRGYFRFSILEFSFGLVNFVIFSNKFFIFFEFISSIWDIDSFIVFSKSLKYIGILFVDEEQDSHVSCGKEELKLILLFEFFSKKKFFSSLIVFKLIYSLSKFDFDLLLLNTFKNSSCA